MEVAPNVLICPVYDCEVSQWAEWAQCSADSGPGACGRGTQLRRRLVTRPESNGGVSCPDLHQSRVCHVPCPEPAAIREKSATDVDKPRRLSGRKHKESSALRGDNYGLNRCNILTQNSLIANLHRCKMMMTYL